VGAEWLTTAKERSDWLSARLLVALQQRSCPSNMPDQAHQSINTNGCFVNEWVWMMAL